MDDPFAALIPKKETPAPKPAAQSNPFAALVPQKETAPAAQSNPFAAMVPAKAEALKTAPKQDNPFSHLIPETVSMAQKGADAVGRGAQYVGDKIKDSFNQSASDVVQGFKDLGARPTLDKGVGGYVAGEAKSIGAIPKIAGAVAGMAFSPLQGVSDAVKEKTAAPARKLANGKMTPGAPGIDLSQAMQLAVPEKGAVSRAAAATADKNASLARTAAESHVYGDEKTPVQRLDNALYRAQGGTTADKLEVQEFLKTVPERLRDPKRQEQLYHELEQRMVDPKHKLSPDAQEALDAYEPYHREQTKLVNEIRAMKAKGFDVEPYLEDQGYVPRRAVGHTPAMDDLTTARDPITGRALNKSTNALMARKNNVVVTDTVTGQTHFIADAGEEYKPGGKIQGMNGNMQTIRPATTAEIEANTGTQYHKNAMVNTLDNVVRLRQVKRNLQVLDTSLADLKAEGLAHRAEWTHTNENGETVVRKGRKAPDGFVELPNIPQLKGWKFAPEAAEVFKDYRPPPNEALEDTLTKINRGLTSTLFWNPIPHAWNVGNHWAVARGFDWMTPGGYKSLVVNGARAVQSVLSKDEAYRSMLREGSGLLYGDTQTKNFYDVMLRKGTQEFASDPRSVDAIKKSFGLSDLDPRKLTKAIYSASNKMLWGANDIFMLQRQYELMDKGMSAREAIAAAEKDIPNYRIPSRVMGRRDLSEAIRNPNLMMFGRYRYGQIKAWGDMFSDMYRGNPEQRTEAAGKFLVAAILAGGAYPLADEAVKKISGNENARVHRGGGFTPVDAATQLATGQKNWMAFMGSIMELAPVNRVAETVVTNKDPMGRTVIEGTPKQAAVQAAETAAGFVPPAQSALALLEGPQEAKREAGRNLLVDLPTDKTMRGRALGPKYQRQEAQRRAKKDPILQKLGGPN